MKVAIISDIHGNLPALKTAVSDIDQWQPDHVIVNGDIVNRGPLSADCLTLVLDRQQKQGWQMVRGNHEDYLLECEAGNLAENGPEAEINQFAYFAHAQLNGRAPILATFPKSVSLFAPDGSELRATHGSMRHNRDGIYLTSADDELRAQIAPPPAIFVTAHTHRPLIRHIDQTTVVNIGSVGASFDGDRRLSYGRFTWTQTEGWQVEIVRLPYDTNQIEKDYVTSGFLEGGGPLAQLMLLELRRAGGLIYRWASRYQDAVVNGDISLADSVRELMRDEDLRPFLGPPGWTP
jgi:predicted phosphodiesterase